MYERKVCKNCCTLIPIDIPMYMRGDMCFCTFHCRHRFFHKQKLGKRIGYTCLGLFFN